MAKTRLLALLLAFSTIAYIGAHVYYAARAVLGA